MGANLGLESYYQNLLRLAGEALRIEPSFSSRVSGRVLPIVWL